MRVLIINVVCGVGSTGHIAVDLYHRLESEGNQCCIAYGRGTAPSGLQTIKIGNTLDQKLHGVLTRVCDRHGFGSKRATQKLIQQIEEYNPDVIHLHNIHGYYLNIEILFHYLKTSHKRIIWTLHDCWAMTGHCSHYSYVKCEKWKCHSTEGLEKSKGWTHCCNCPEKVQYPASILIDHSKKNYIRKKELFTGVDNMEIVVPSNWLKTQVELSFLGGYPVTVIHNGIDMDIFKPTQSNSKRRIGIEDTQCMILGVANIWNARKGLQGFEKLSRLLDPKQYRIVLVGLTSEQIDKLPAPIIGIERTNSVEELAQLYTTADIYVNLSVEETFGLTTAEAMACGTPVIVYNATAVPEIVTKETGIVVEQGNVEMVAESVHQLGQHKVKYTERCISHIKQFDVRENNRKYMEIYRRIYQ